MSDTVHQMFRRIAKRYDIANDVLSFGLHRCWRKAAVRRGGIAAGWRVLDLCSGTGDFSREILHVVGTSGSVVSVDFVYEMLALARKKSLLQRTPQVRGDAMKLPFPASQFDAVTIGFGIRNVDDPLVALGEIRRVLRPGGKLVVLEFGRPLLPGFALLYRLYSKFLMPQLGGLLTGNREAYKYLPETAARFPDGPQFIELLQNARIDCTACYPLLSGLAYIYIGSTPQKVQASATESAFLAQL